MRERERISDPVAMCVYVRRGKDFPYDPSLNFRAVSWRCNRRINAIHSWKKTWQVRCLKASLRYSRVITVSMGNHPEGWKPSDSIYAAWSTYLSADKENRRGASNPFRSIHLVIVFGALALHKTRARMSESSDNHPWEAKCPFAKRMIPFCDACIL